EHMVETDSSSRTRFMNQIINVKLRQYAANARRQKARTDIAKLKERTLEELYTFLVTNFGMPPERFDFEYVDKDERYHIVKDLTPKAFYQDQIGDVLKDYISIINAPTKDKPYLKTYTVAYLGNVVGGRPIKYLNLPMKDFKALVLRQLLSDEIVWFGSDVARYGKRTGGFWDDESFDFENMLEMDLYMSKEDELDYSQGAMNHAMVLTAVNLDEGMPNRWKIENSWGDKDGEKGYFLASDSWFDRYVYQAVIHRKYLDEEHLAAWEKEPVVLKPWDPMGSLAQ
ncbi:MAG: C1 family peptidase, partial [Acholeplasmataceae bacterium]